MPDTLPSFDFDRAFRDFQTRLRTRLKTAMTDVTLRVQREAIRNAPKSPTQARIRKDQAERWKAKGKKPTKRQKEAWAARRNPRAHGRPKPGGLEESIEAQVINYTRGEVFVEKQSRAGKYAKRIHDEKGVTWKNRGPGTVAKGARADDKFIERAIEDPATQTYAMEQFQKAIDKTLEEGVK